IHPGVLERGGQGLRPFKACFAQRRVARIIDFFSVTYHDDSRRCRFGGEQRKSLRPGKDRKEQQRNKTLPGRELVF
ncbi:MAG: hypothetical protein KGY49_10635, partial [Wenzhouxiangellaceae bacterium]|nr:hypothetical protein [Wenzhouxiangellaceae bacterium]